MCQPANTPIADQGAQTILLLPDSRGSHRSGVVDTDLSLLPSLRLCSQHRTADYHLALTPVRPGSTMVILTAHSFWHLAFHLPGAASPPAYERELYMG